MALQTRNCINYNGYPIYGTDITKGEIIETAETLIKVGFFALELKLPRRKHSICRLLSRNGTLLPEGTRTATNPSKPNIFVSTYISNLTGYIRGRVKRSAPFK